MRKYSIPILIMILIAGIGFWLIFLPVSPGQNGEVQFSVKKREGSKDIALNLRKNNLIRSEIAFRTYVLVRGIAGDLKAGEYQLSPIMNVPEIADKLVKGDVIKISVTIPEGWTQQQIEEKLGLELPGENLEGFLFPDTYQFPFGFSGQEVVDKMQDNFEEKMTLSLREEIERQGKTIFEIVTMASLIEKEVYNTPECPDCKGLVSGILWKRLKIGMPLQVDAERWTYDNLGLPPKPICNPGLESIMAAVYSEDSDYWYYLSTPEGETIFSKTLEEHNLAKAQHLE